MAKLDKDKAFQSSGIEELLRTGFKTLATAQEVSDSVEKCLTQIRTRYGQIPAGAKDNGVDKAARDLENTIAEGNYTQERLKMQKALAKVNQTVPQYDKMCAGELKQLADV